LDFQVFLEIKRIDFPKQKKLVLYSGLSGGYAPNAIKANSTAIVETSQGKIIMNETVEEKTFSLDCKTSKVKTLQVLIGGKEPQKLLIS
jgi:hypothetical protein